MTTTLQSDTLPIELAGERGQPCLAPQGQRGAGERRERAVPREGRRERSTQHPASWGPCCDRTRTLSQLREPLAQRPQQQDTSTLLQESDRPTQPGKDV